MMALADGVALGKSRRVVELTTKEAMRCHRPTNRRTARDCLAHAKILTPKELGESSFPELASACFNVTWQSVVAARGDKEKLGTTGAWGSCVATVEDDSYRYFTSNSVPSHFFPPYCPLGIGLGYCVANDDDCAFDGLVCGDVTSVGSSRGFTPFGDVKPRRSRGFAAAIDEARRSGCQRLPT